MEHVAKVLEFVANYAWAVLAVCVFALVLPSDAADQLGLLNLREEYKGPLWLLAAFTGALSFAAVLRYIDDRILGNWLAERRSRKKQAADRIHRMSMLAKRLDTLNEGECAWVQYCLYHNVQTLSAERINTTAQSLLNKRLVSEGSGNMLDLPYHVPDDVWELLQERRRDFLSEDDERNPEFERYLRDFRRSLWPDHWR